VAAASEVSSFAIGRRAAEPTAVLAARRFASLRLLLPNPGTRPGLLHQPDCSPKEDPTTKFSKQE